MTERKARSPTALVDEGRVFDRLEDGLQRVLHRQYKTGGQLTQLPPRVHQRGGIGEKLQCRHHLIEGICLLRHLRLGIKDRLSQGHMIGRPAKHLLWGLYDLALVILLEVTGLEDAEGVFSQIQRHDIIV